MSVVTADTSATAVLRVLQPRPRRLRKDRKAEPLGAYVPAADYIPHSTADMWRSARRRSDY